MTDFILTQVTFSHIIGPFPQKGGIVPLFVALRIAYIVKIIGDKIIKPMSTSKKSKILLKVSLYMLIIAYYKYPPFLPR